MSIGGSILEQLAEETWDRLDLSHRLKCSQSEETFTDINLLELIRRRPPGLRVYKARGRDEPKKGFDWDWYVGANGVGWLRYSIQAKKLDIGSNRYSTFRHKVGTRYQIDILKDFARRNRTIPPYCFYNAAGASVEKAHWHCNLPFRAKQLGCSLAPLSVAQRLHQRRVSRSFETAHHDARVIPWRCIATCPFMSPKSTLGRHHPLAPDGQEVRVLPELPGFLREDPQDAHPVELPTEGYASEFGAFPRWIMVIDLGT
jgi:hypothetical protein